MRQEKNPPRRRGLSCLASPCSPSLVARCNPLERSHTGVISLSSASVQMNVIKKKNHKATMYSRHPTHPNSAAHFSGMSFQNLFCAGGRGRALTPAGTSLLPPFSQGCFPAAFPCGGHHCHAVLLTATSLCSPSPPAHARWRLQSAISLMPLAKTANGL